MYLVSLTNRFVVLSLGLIALAGAASAESTAWSLAADKSPVTFVATGKPGFLKIRGEGSTAKGSAKIDDGKLTGVFEVALAPFKTGIDLRDEHMHGKYLESAKFPVAKLVIDPLAVKAGASDYDFAGKLTLKGVEKPVQGKLELDLGADKATGKASFEVKLSDFPVGVPSHLGVSVAETVQVEVAFQAEKRMDIAAKP